MCIAKNKKLMVRIKSVTLARPLKSSSFCIIVTIKIKLLVLYLIILYPAPALLLFLAPIAEGRIDVLVRMVVFHKYGENINGTECVCINQTS